jgi:hypothetical protein
MTKSMKSLRALGSASGALLAVSAPLVLAMMVGALRRAAPARRSARW